MQESFVVILTDAFGEPDVGYVLVFTTSPIPTPTAIGYAQAPCVCKAVSKHTTAYVKAHWQSYNPSYFDTLEIFLVLGKLRNPRLRFPK